MEAVRIEVFPLLQDSRGQVLQRRFAGLGVSKITALPVYTIDKKMEKSAITQLAESLTNPVAQEYFVLEGNRAAPPSYMMRGEMFSWALEIGFLPGVTDNVGATARQIAEDLQGTPFQQGEAVYSSELLLIHGNLGEQAIKKMAATLANPLIQRTHIRAADDFLAKKGMDIVTPKVTLHDLQEATEVNLNVPDAELAEIGKSGIANADGKRRGPLGLSLHYMKAIQAHFAKLGRNPTDIELETLAQTWSEHCKHTIFASPIDDIKDGIFKHFIRRATEDIRKRKGNQDICVSVFKDNSGAIAFDDEWLITDKVETHNSPSALDPFGGAITGIVGVNRDCLGFGKGARPVINRYGFCLADPRSEPKLYRDKEKKNPALSPQFIMEGVVAGVNAGGNTSGIPTPQGFLYFDERYGGKPLVFAGTVGLIPREVAGAPSHVKAAQPGDCIVMIGGRVGKDGIHGATFSSVALDEGSPATAVQIGDPITQKKFSDAIVREARQLGLYNAITDNGAGGLSSSVGEMGGDSGGFEMELEKVPLKYPGMSPWEIWISESQERMTLAVPPANVEPLFDLLKRRGVEATVIGRFTDSGRAVVKWHGKTIMEIGMDFLHDGVPLEQLITKQPAATQTAAPKTGSQGLPADGTLTKPLLSLLSSLNICSKEFVSTQYDHEVQASSVLKPLHGKGRVGADAAVSRPVLSSPKGVVTSQGLCPRLSDYDTYHMAANAIDMAVRNAIAVGCNPDHLALLDNFCWCSSDEPERLWQLKRAAQACYDYAVAYGAPFISGKDSMFNDFKGYDENGQPVKISIPPTLLVSALGVIDNIADAVSQDAKIPGDLIYILGETKDEMLGSEFSHHYKTGDSAVPNVNASAALSLYQAYHQALRNGWVASCMPVGFGGLGVALAKKAIAGRLGMKLDLAAAPRFGTVAKDEIMLFSETASRLVVTISPRDKVEFELFFQGYDIACIGEVTGEPGFTLRGIQGTEIISATVDALEEAYKAPLRGY